MKSYLQSNSRKLYYLLLLLPLFFTASCDKLNDLTGGSATISKLEGEWTCNEQSEVFKATTEVYTVTLSANADNPSGIIIDNFYGLQASAKATVANMSMIISNQSVEGGFTVSGSGTISSNFREINLKYTVDDGSGVVDHVTAVYTKN
jgi:hypothetical protein